MRCKACNRFMDEQEIIIDDEMCKYCLQAIREDLPIECKKKLKKLFKKELLNKKYLED